MSKTIYVKLPVADVARSSAFFGKLGFEQNVQFTSEEKASFKVSDEIYLLLADREHFGQTAAKSVADPSTTAGVIVYLSAATRDEVDEFVELALDSGATPANDPQDAGSIYGRSFLDPDGHQWEIAWMDPNLMVR